MGRDRKKQRRRRPPPPPPQVTLEDFGPEDHENILAATADLCGRAGAREFDVGYLHDDVPTEEAGWYAFAQFKGARKIAENHRGPVEAAFALAVDILTGGRCKCGKLVALSPAGGIAYGEVQLAHGQGRWTLEEAKAAGQCHWRLIGASWTPSCTAPAIDVPGGR